MAWQHRQLLTVAIVLASALTVPAAALASGSRHAASNSGCISAVCVYVEGFPTDTGNRPAGGGGSAAANGGGGGGTVALSPRAKHALARSGGKDTSRLRQLATYYAPRRLQGSDRAGSPSVLGAAFDLGSGPTILFVLLAASLGLLIVGGGMRVLRQRR